MWMGDSIPPEVHDKFFLPVDRLIIVLDEANQRGVVRKLDDGVGAMFRSAVVGEEGVN